MEFTDHASPSDSECPFCRALIRESIIEEECGSVVAIKDKYPVTEGHHLIITRRHVQDYFTMNSRERKDAEDLLIKLKDRIARIDETVTGFNLGVNCGESAGQTVWHAHIHLIPRRDGDTPNPRGGVRGVIPEEMDYGS